MSGVATLIRLPRVPAARVSTPVASIGLVVRARRAMRRSKAASTIFANPGGRRQALVHDLVEEVLVGRNLNSVPEAGGIHPLRQSR